MARSPHKTKQAAQSFERNSGPVGGIAIARGKALTTIRNLKASNIMKEVSQSAADARFAGSIKALKKGIRDLNSRIAAKRGK